MLDAVKSRILLPVLALLAASACDSTASLQHLRNAPEAKSAYHQTLATLYQAYAETEEAAYDWWTSKYFADKGLMVAYGKDVAPEDPSRWHIAKDAQADLFAAREQLISLLTEDTIAAHPTEAATAVAAYDCWIEQQDDGWKQDRIALCRGEFEKALAIMHGANAQTLPIEVPKKPAPTITSSILYFPFDTEVLENTGMRVLNQLIDYLKNAGPVDIALNGHADRVGNDEYNMKLSEERAKYVKTKLVEAGIDAPRISYFGFGETDPKVPTADGVKEPANRRVEIFLE